MSNAFQFRMPSGIPGDVNRSEHATVEPQSITPAGTTGAPTGFGIPVVIDATTGNVRMLAAADTVAYGMLARPFPFQGPNASDSIGTSVPPASGACDVMVRGYMMVKLNGGATIKKGGLVYARIQNAASGKPVGGIEGAADGGNTIALPASCYFTGPADAQANTEIAFNI